MKNLRMMVVLGYVLLTGVLVACSPASTAPQAPEPGPEMGNVAPDFRLQDTSGQDVSLSQFRGKPVLLNFWATWCPPCRQEMPLIQEIFEDKTLAGKGLVVLGVNIGETSATAADFMKSNGYSFAVALDTRQVVADQYAIRAIPTTFFIDKDGVIRDVKIGAFLSKSQVVMGLNKIIP